ncbi:MAG: hypothetical protein LBH96_03610 [Candidatus Peribacteria bacterium]|jgi:hypothetical protein|nr:hypothetical protein [Candidatus Peribacteria bacterium]
MSVEHIPSETEILQQLGSYPSWEDSKRLLAQILDDNTYKQGIRDFFGIQGMKNPYLYEACKRSELMDIYGEATIQRLVIKEFLALSPEEINKYMPSNTLVCELAKRVKTKYTPKNSD